MSKLLVVDYHDATRWSLKTYLSTALPNSCVRDARSAPQALEMVAAEIPDVVVVDFTLPHMSGAAATREIKLRWPEVHVIMLIMDPSQLVPASDAGADACVIKGGESGELLRAVLGLSPNA